MSKLAIIITAYNRAQALKSLLNSLNTIKAPFSIPLIISIDNFGTEDVVYTANEFVWKYGPKEVIVHQHKKGLVNHFIWVGDQTEKYDNILFLEDDLIVSPEIVNFSCQLIEYYKEDMRITGASFYNPVICELNNTRFYQVQDGNDVYFLQHPYWGNLWFKKQWNEFKHYLTTYTEKKILLPKCVAGWSQSFKKIYIQFLIESGKTMIVPRISLVSNTGTIGLHSQADNLVFQAPLLYLTGNHFNFVALDDSYSKYDAFFDIDSEILKKIDRKLTEYDFDVDIQNCKFDFSKPFVLTTKNVSQYILSFSIDMKPIEASVFFQQYGEGLYLCKREHVNKISTNNYRYLSLVKNEIITLSLAIITLRHSFVNSLKCRFSTLSILLRKKINSGFKTIYL